MKKILVFLLTGVMLTSVLTACTSKDGDSNGAGNNTAISTETQVNTEIEVNTGAVVDTEAEAQSELFTVVNEIYENHAAIEFYKDTTQVDISDADTLNYYTGLSSADKLVEVVCSEPMTGSQAYSLVVARVKDAADAQSVAQEIYDNVNQRKWVCVEANDKMAAVSGDLVVFVMVDEVFAPDVTAQSIIDAFQAYCGGSVDSKI